MMLLREGKRKNKIIRKAKILDLKNMVNANKVKNKKFWDELL